MHLKSKYTITQDENDLKTLNETIDIKRGLVSKMMDLNPKLPKNERLDLSLYMKETMGVATISPSAAQTSDGPKPPKSIQPKKGVTR